jgi:hypothetical protein
MLRFRSMLFVVALLAALVPTAATGASPAAQDAIARVRFVHASFDAPSLDIYLDGAVAESGVRGMAGYRDVPVGEHTFSFRTAGGAEDLASVTVTLEANQRVTIAAVGTLAELEAMAIVDDVSAPPRNAARLTVVHASPDAPPVNVSVNATAIASDLAYQGVSAPGYVFAGSYDIAVTTADGTPVVTDSGRQFTEDRAYTAFVVGTAASGAFRLVVAESTVLKPEPTSQFRFANMAPDAGPLNVHINQEPAPLYSGVPFGNVQHYYVAGPGPYQVDLYQSGTGPDNSTPLATLTTEIDANQNVLFVAQGSGDAVEVAAYTGDFSPLPPQSSRLTVINLATGNPPIKVERMEGGTLFDSVDVYDQAGRVVPAGSYNIRFVDAASGDNVMEKGGIQMPAGTVTMLIAFDDDPNDPLMNTVAVSTENVPTYAAIRWAHFNIWGPPVDVYMNGEKVMSSLVYKMSTEYMLYAPDVYTIEVYPVGAAPADDTTEPLDSVQAELTGDNFPRTFFIYGPPDGARIGIAPDNLEMLSPGKSRVRFINAGIDLPGVAVYNPTGNTQVVDNIPNGGASSNANLDAGTYSFNFVTDLGAVASVQGLEVESGVVYTIVVAGVYTDPTGLETIVVEATP